MSVYLQYKSIYNDSNAFYANDITVTEQAFDIYKKHVANGNIIGWGKQDFPETLTKTISIEYVDSDAYQAHYNDLVLIGTSDASWVVNTDHKLVPSL